MTSSFLGLWPQEGSSVNAYFGPLELEIDVAPSRKIAKTNCDYSDATQRLYVARLTYVPVTVTVKVRLSAA